MEVTTNSAKETKEFGKKFSKSLKPGDVICLFGDLGTGKTTFVQGIAQGLRIKKRILSPSFLFFREYDLGSGKKFYHVDIFRIESSQKGKDLGLQELFENKNNIVVIEWPEKLGEFLPKERIEIYFEYGKKENQRKIKIRRRD